METQKSSSVYVSSSRADAVRLAKEVSTAQGKNGLVVAWRMFKSGITRKVRVSSDASISELQKHLSKNDLKPVGQKKMSDRKVSPHKVPSDFKWSHGDAKNLAHHVVVRHWTTPGIANSSIHTALSMKAGPNVNEYAGWLGSKKTRTDWQESSHMLKRVLAPVKTKFDYYSYQRIPTCPKSYRQEKGYYISDRTKEKLKQGSLEPMSEGQEKIESVKNASFKPLPSQKTSSKNHDEWQRRAEKHYLPCVGKTTDKTTQEEKFVMFGLKLNKMRERWQEVSQPDNSMHCYKMVSKEQNCAGMTWHLLKAGGSKNYVDFHPHLVTTRTDMEKYADKLEKRLSYLNHCADVLMEKCSEYSIFSERSTGLKGIIEEIGLDPAEKDDSSTLEWKEEVRELMKSQPKEWHQKFNEVVRLIHILDKVGGKLDSSSLLAQKLTISTYELFDMTKAQPELLESNYLDPMLKTFRLLRENTINA